MAGPTHCTGNTIYIKYTVHCTGITLYMTTSKIAPVQERLSLMFLDINMIVRIGALSPEINPVS